MIAVHLLVLTDQAIEVPCGVYKNRPLYVMIHIVCLPDSSERDVVNPRLNPKFITFLIRSVRLFINHILRNPPQAHLKAVSVFIGTEISE